MSRKAKSNPNLGKKFRIYVKPVDDYGYPDETRFGWVSSNSKNEIVLRTFSSNAIVFTEKEDGHGSFEDWKNLLLEDHPDWRILNGPSYLP